MNVGKTNWIRTLLACAIVVSLQAAPAFAAGDITLSAKALDAADDNRFFTRVGGTVRQTLSFEGLEAGKPYTASSRLFNTTTQTEVGDVTIETFEPEAAAGEIAIELPMPQNRTDFNIDYVVLTSLYEGTLGAGDLAAEQAVMELDDMTDIDATVQSHAIQSVSVAASTDEGLSLPPEGGIIHARVDHENLVAGYPYTVWGQLMTPSGQVTGIYASVSEYVPDDKQGSLELEFTVPEGWDGIRLVPTVGLYHQKRVKLRADGSLSFVEGAPMPVMIASDLSVEDPAQTVNVGTPFEDLPKE